MKAALAQFIFESNTFASIPFTGSRRELWPVDPDPANPIAIWEPDASG